jgi:hypothetical protein
VGESERPPYRGDFQTGTVALTLKHFLVELETSRSAFAILVPRRARLIPERSLALRLVPRRARLVVLRFVWCLDGHHVLPLGPPEARVDLRR